MMRDLNRLRRIMALFICPELGVEARPRAACEASKRSHHEQPVFVIDPELRIVLRHRRVERAKQVLKVIQLVEQGGVTDEPDLPFDRAAEELAVLLFGDA